jgi:uncharacterized SAM-binding protein YcdF (DUF218 family)
VLGVLAFTPLMRRPVNALVRSDPLPAALDAVVVLSGGVSSDGHLKPMAADRLLSGLSLVRRGVAPLLILSRDRWRDGAAEVTTDADQQRLIALLAPTPRLIVVDSVFSTRDEAMRIRALADSLGVRRVAVVTSPTHTYRACATFEKVGFAVTCVPSESREVALRGQRLVSDRVRAFQLWLYEIAGIAKYRANGWI